MSLKNLMKPIYKILSTNLMLIIFLLGYSGCLSVKRKDVKNPVELPEAFTFTGTENLPEKWWQSLNDPDLNELIEEALGSNFSIRSSWDRLRQAEQVAIKMGAKLYPDANFQGSAERSRQDISNKTTYTSNFFFGSCNIL